MALLIIKTGSTMQSIGARFGDFETWFQRHLTAPSVRVVAVHEGDALPQVGAVDRVVITGSPHMVTARAPWSERTAQWLQQAHVDGVPMLGVCYGHQLLAHALGGEVAWNPNGRQIGYTTVQLTAAAQADALLGATPTALSAFTTHQQAVTRLPPNAVRLATTPKDPNHAFRLGASTWGVQFHPEFDPQIMSAYLAERRIQLEAESIDVDALQAAIQPAPDATAILTRFAQLPSRCTA
jgi:GMP synthase (glutamine-hydrolysing)